MLQSADDNASVELGNNDRIAPESFEKFGSFESESEIPSKLKDAEDCCNCEHGCWHAFRVVTSFCNDPQKFLRSFSNLVSQKHRAFVKNLMSKFKEKY